MASKATERIRRVMTKLMMEGKLDQPYYPNGKPRERNKRKRCRTCKRYEDFESFNKDGLCGRCVRAAQETQLMSEECCVGSLSRLPDGVVSCPNCPLDS